MASTYTPNDALAICGGFIRQMSIPPATSTILMDEVNSTIWSHYYWPWSLATMTRVVLVDGVQDYAISDPTTIPVRNADFYRFYALRITQTDVTPNSSRELDIVEFLPPDLQVKFTFGQHRAASWMPTISKVRLDGAASVSGTTVLYLEGEYQKMPTKITLANLGSVFSFPDHYFETFCEGLLYRLYKYGDDDRAGSIVVAKSGDRQYTGQLGVWMYKLQEMAEAEDYGSGQAQRFPAEPLGTSRGSWPGPIF